MEGEEEDVTPGNKRPRGRPRKGQASPQRRSKRRLEYDDNPDEEDEEDEDEQVSPTPLHRPAATVAAAATAATREGEELLVTWP